ncbi:proteasome assembly chaperone family protein [Thermosphaera chiliense]|uniref:Proteasome assembly chaperone family protein n=1 Tax=Thermosphaera chiliense TaxID=3402707 RepID=A0A7M1UTT1_9CREN|nr:PAC2 family protein [Thermosphaera aggregans]QOR94284.1 proteasome assembly chaperone family protein [Thermosphaera aggregans]
MLGRPRRTLLFNELQIHEYYDAYATPTPKYMILCFPDVGLVSSIACRHIVMEKKLGLVGEIDSPTLLPPVSVIHESSPISPVQLYMPEDRSFLMVLSEIPLIPGSVYPFVNAISSYADEVGVEYLLAVTGLAVPNRLELEKPQVFVASSKEEVYASFKGENIEALREGFIVGPYALLLKEGRRKGFSTVVFLVESFLDIPDPEAAAFGIAALSRFAGIQVDTKKLLEEAELIKLRTRDLMMQTRKAMMDMQKQMERQMPLMYM